MANGSNSLITNDDNGNRRQQQTTRQPATEVLKAQCHGYDKHPQICELS